MVSPVCVGDVWEEGGEFLMDGGGQTVALKRLHEPHADDALILASNNPQRIGIGAGRALKFLCTLRALTTAARSSSGRTLCVNSHSASITVARLPERRQ